MKAVIMAGGEGTRLRPLTSKLPKPMLPVANRPLMEHIIRLLGRHGMNDIVVTVAFLASTIRSYFGDGSDLGADLSYATEDTPLGTAGSVRNAAEHLRESFMVISGDALTDIDLSAVCDWHRKQGALATVVLSRVENPLEFGIVITKEDGQIERFLEKPGWGQVFSDTINTGIYVFEPEVFDYIPAEGPADFSEDVFPALLDKGAPLFGYVADGYWCDVGNHPSYLKVHKDVLDRKVDVDIEGFELSDGVWVGEGLEIDPDAMIEGPALIGDFCSIGPGAEVGEYTVLGNNVVLRDEASVHRSIIHDNAHLGPLVQLRGCVIGKNADLRRRAVVGEGAVLGEETFVGEDAVVNPDVKIYPFKTVEPGALITRSIVWESMGASQLVGPMGVTGIANVDVTPEMVVRLAMAYGSGVPKGSLVATVRDASKAARTLKRAAIAGLNATGVHVDDLEIATLPVARFHIRTMRAGGGICITTAPDDPLAVRIRLLDSSGQDLDDSARRKVERSVSRGDFRRAFASDIGEIFYPPRAIEFYTAALNKAADTATIRSARLKVVVDHAWSPTSVILPRTIGRLGIDLLALNAYIDPEHCILLEEERAEALVRISDTVHMSGSHFGVLFDPSGEYVDLVDDSGRVLTAAEAAQLFARLVVRSTEEAVVALPVSASRALEAEVVGGGGKVVWTELTPARAGETAAAEGADLAVGAEAGLIFPEFMPAFDGIAAFLKLAAWVAGLDHPLSEEVDELRPSQTVHEKVHVPKETKGLVMREMAERARGKDAILVDGVRFEVGGGWVLVAPDSSEPVCHVWAEGPDEGSGEEIAAEFVRRIQALTG